MSRAELDAFLSDLDVSRETAEMFQQYKSLLLRWTRKINLVSASSMDQIWRRHFLDSAQLWAIGPQNGHWADLGSGGGFPGLVLAILGRETKGLSITLIESDARKATFLRTVIRELGLNATVRTDRIEDSSPVSANVVTARALAPLTTLLGFADRHLAPDGIAMFLKGENVDVEIEEALERWRFRCEKHPSMTEANSAILSVGGIERV